MDEASAIEAAVGLAALLIGGASGYALGRGWIPLGAGRETESESVPQDQATTERDHLIRTCANVADRLRDRQHALYTVLARDLAVVGVELNAPDGEPFDAGQHNAVGTEPAPGQAQDLLIAETIRLGCRHHGVQVRVPDVIVYRWKES
jgi:hypothetical protein